MNFSTKASREDMRVLDEYLPRLEERHEISIEMYGEGVKDRLCGHHETQHWGTFNSGTADRGSSIRVPTFTYANGKGYFEDRRPGANADPYLVTGAIVDTCILAGTKTFDDMVEHFKKWKNVSSKVESPPIEIANV